MPGLFDDVLNGDGPLRITVTPKSDQPIPDAGKQLLSAIYGSESPDYNTMYGGAKFSDYSDHPRQRQLITSGPNAGKYSTAAGAPQFLASTWDEVKKDAGLPDFSPDSQDRGAWHLAQKTYKLETQRDLATDLESAKNRPDRHEMIHNIGRALSRVWTSLPDGSEPNSQTMSFADRYDAAAQPVRAQATPSQPQPRVGLFDDFLQDQKLAHFAPVSSGRFSDNTAINLRLAREGESPPAPQSTRLSAFLSGLKSGASANFGDELSGVFAAGSAGLNLPPDAHQSAVMTPLVGLARLGYEYLTGNPGEATKAYEEARDKTRDETKTAESQHPGMYTAGAIGGSLALPVGGAVQAATLPGRIARGAAIGAGYGGLAGAGEGETLPDRAIGGATGAAIGGAIGGAFPPVAEAAIAGARFATAPVRRALAGSLDPEAEAGRRVATAIERDTAADPGASARLTPQQFADAQARGQPVALMDQGGELTRRVADAAAITSPEGGQVLNRALNDRFESQGNRLTDWLRQTFHYPNADEQRQAIEQSARAANRPAYQRAFSENDGPMWDEGFAALAQDPVMQSAIRRAAVSVRTERTLEGYRPFNNPFSFEESSGRLTLRKDANGKTIYPDLRFWDLVKRELDKTNTREAQSFAATLRNHLDELTRSPETGQSSYQAARQGAAHFFGAETALEAGQNFVGASARFGLPDARRVLANMTEQQRQLFQDGYVSRFIERLDRVPDRRNVLNQIGQSEAQRAELVVALGRQRASELEAMLRVEGVMDLARQAVQGNSWTAKRLYNLGLAGGSAGLGYGALNQDPQQMTIGAMVAALSSGGRYVDQRVARRVAELLVSNDPARLQRGVQMVARNQRWLAALRSFDQRFAATAGEQAGSQ